MMRACSLLVAAFVLIPINVALAADAPDKPADTPDCTTLAATPANGTSTDRFMREWCQRNAPIIKSTAPTVSTAPDAATPPQPALPTPAPRYSNDDSADQLNSSRLPPGYHCHMLKFGERICHGGLD